MEQNQEQQIFAIKQALINNSKSHYKAFLESIVQLPAHAFQRQQAMINFDQGMMWFTEAVMNAPMAYQDVTPPQPPEVSEGNAEGQPVSQPESDTVQEVQPVTGE